MSIPRSSWNRWWPVIAWMTLIFIGSTNILSAGHTSRIIGPLLRWFKPQVTVETIRAVQTVIRKGGHLTEYAILAVLIRRARGIGAGTGFRTWRSDEFATCVLLAALYAFSDEFHQSFESAREGRLGDVMIDTVGAAAGLLAWQAFRRRQIMQKPSAQSPVPPRR